MKVLPRSGFRVDVIFVVVPGKIRGVRVQNYGTNSFEKRNPMRAVSLVLFNL